MVAKRGEAAAFAVRELSSQDRNLMNALPPNAPTTEPEPPLVTKAKQFIESHYGEELSLGQVARAASSSPFHFCRAFKNATGISFTQYVSRLRVGKAAALLVDQPRRVTEIAFDVGFQSLTNFNRVFKRIVGLSPRQYRKEMFASRARQERSPRPSGAGDSIASPHREVSILVATSSPGKGRQVERQLRRTGFGNPVIQCDAGARPSLKEARECLPMPFP